METAGPVAPKGYITGANNKSHVNAALKTAISSHEVALLEGRLANLGGKTITVMSVVQKHIHALKAHLTVRRRNAEYLRETQTVTKGKRYNRHTLLKFATKKRLQELKGLPIPTAEKAKITSYIAALDRSIQKLSLQEKTAAIALATARLTGDLAPESKDKK